MDRPEDPREPAPSAERPANGDTPRPMTRAPQEQIAPDLERRAKVSGSKLGATYVRRQLPHYREFRPQGSDRLAATEQTLEPASAFGRRMERVRRVLLGQRLTTAQQIHERLTKVKALAILSSDAISSVAYATEASLAILIGAGLAALQVNLVIAGAIAALMLIVGTSYWQTIHAYPHGGGSYIVARDNLGDWSGLIAAAALLIDYVLTVSVSVSSGVDALVSAFPNLMTISVELGVLFIVIIMLVNLRGIRESGTIFAAPTYLFIAVFFLMIIVGVVRAAMDPGGLFTAGPPLHALGDLGWVPERLSLLLVLTAFASGCSAMTGVEAISNGVPAFKVPEARNASRTLVVMVAVLVSLFLGTTYLAWRYGAVPFNGGEPTLVSEIAGVLFTGPWSWLYYVIQFATLLILVLAANTSFADFPRLASILARDGFLPHQFSYRGDRLAFSIGIIVLSVLSSGLMVLFHGNTQALINLYALGVFTAFTLSQSGMVVHWWRLRDSAGARWQRSMVINFVGAATTLVVALVIMVTKFDRGAWIVVLLVPALVLLFRGISRHYDLVQQQMQSLTPLRAEDLRHIVVVPIAELNPPALQSLAYARSITPHVLVVHISTDAQEEQTLRAHWEALVEARREVWGSAAREPGVLTSAGERLITQATAEPSQFRPRLVVIESPYRSLVAPLLAYIDALRKAQPDATVTVVLPEFVPRHWWERLLHNQTALRLKLALYSKPGVVVTNVPYHLLRGGKRTATASR